VSRCVVVYCAVSDGSLQPVSPNNVILHVHAKYLPISPVATRAALIQPSGPVQIADLQTAGLSMFLCCKATLHGRHVGWIPCIPVDYLRYLSFPSRAAPPILRLTQRTEMILGSLIYAKHTNGA
jgi:hypothetical protein